MSVTPADVAVELGVAAPESGSLTEQQWLSWINQARYLIGKRLGDITLLDEGDVDYVVLQAVAAHARRPDGSTQVDVAVDDGRVSKRYTSSAGAVTILPEWWALLDPDLTDSSGVGSTQMFGEPDLSSGLESWA